MPGPSPLTAILIMLLVVSNCRTPSVGTYAALLVQDEDTSAGYGLTVTFLGTTTLLFDDGETAFITDGFFSRPSLRNLVRLSPNESIISASLERAGITSLTAVIPVHSHYDHVLDAPVVARLTEALLVGSESSANVARGQMLPESQIMVVEDGEVLRFGRFQVTFVGSRHHARDIMPGSIPHPLSSTARVDEYRTGDCFSLLIEHETRTMLVHASAGFIPGALDDHAAEVAFLGIGRLGKSNEKYRQAYWEEVVQAVDARRVIPIHWDNFFRPLDKPLVPMPRLIDDFDASMRFLLKRGGQTNVEIQIPIAWLPIDPFSRLHHEERAR
jgi:L-ascorbate metabolism protein UlaG (beta-lactamase superfamily)